MSEHAAGAALCTNCGDPRIDVFCAKCGEKQPNHHDLTMGHLAHETFHELVHLDSKLFRTLRDLVTRPGELTAAYFAGRKTRYIGPLRLFLTFFALQFLALVYLFLAVRRFYGQSTGKTLTKTVLAFAGNWLVNVILLTGALVAAIVQVL